MKVIEQSQIESTTWYSVEAILQQCVSEFTQSRQVVQQKRYIFRDRLKQYNNQVKNRDVVSVNLCFAIINALIASSYTDELTVSFVERDPSDILQANTRTKIAEFDKENMELDRVNYEKLQDKYFYGVGIRWFDWWDDDENQPIVSNFDPMTWIPDPKWWKDAESFRWMWFQSMMMRDDMKANGFYEDQIENFVKMYDSEFYMFDPYNALPPNLEKSTNDDIRYRYVYYHYTIINGKKYQVATDYSMTTLGRLVSIDAILQAEKKDTRKILRPITLSYFRPQRHNPYWVSIMDLTEDKQRALSKLFNLWISRATRNSLGWHRLYNKDKIPNRNDLANLTEDPKLIGVNLMPNENLSNVMTEVQTMQVPQDNFNMTEAIQYQTRFATGVDPLTMWIQSQWDITATEAQQIQANANLLLWLTNQVDLRSEKDFRRKYMKMYKQFFKGRKIIRVVNSIGTNMIEIKKDDIRTKEDPDVMIMGKNESKKREEIGRNTLQGILPFLQQEWWFAYKQWLRDLIRFNGIDNDRANVYVPDMPEEIEAKGQLEMLNRNENLDEGQFQDMSKDRDAYIAIYRQAIDTPAKMKAMKLALNAKVMKKQMDVKQAQAMQAQWWQQWPSNWLISAASAQMTNQAMTKPKTPLSTANAVPWQ